MDSEIFEEFVVDEFRTFVHKCISGVARNVGRVFTVM